MVMGLMVVAMVAFFSFFFLFILFLNNYLVIILVFIEWVLKVWIGVAVWGDRRWC
ncbi:hypothetical protein BDV24DRAFT_122842 [Aspergillus arachidicola]|uniref:Transmembrane protein n=1 Tax=Aspergillus arachidicola TaxID=656916 RepID=A0A5N6YNV8_9EURO|nr:hypothetical protein BDV24DRAFT_122842 [Aspergillus arachidicola]